jgi:ribosome-associated translation inhibitor RaiA
MRKSHFTGFAITVLATFFAIVAANPCEIVLGSPFGNQIVIANPLCALTRFTEAFNRREAKSSKPTPQATADGASTSSSECERINKAIRSLEKQIEDHQAKLAAYIADPYAQDNLGILRDAPNDELRRKIIEGRIAKLQKEIQTFSDEIEKLKVELKHKGC